MPLIRKDAPLAAAAQPETGQPGAGSAHAGPDDRWRAVRALGDGPGDVDALGLALADEPDLRVREAIFTALARAGTMAAFELILAQVRSNEASLRTGALDALRGMTSMLQQRLPEMLRDPDPDVRLLVAELARGLPAAEASRILCDLIDGEDQPNVCAAAVDVLAEVGSSDALPVLARCAQRFASEPFLGFAIKVAAQRIGDPPRG